MLATDFGPEIN